MPFPRLTALVAALAAGTLPLRAQAPRSPEYAATQARLARGWNSWDVASVTAQARLPEGFTLRVGLKHNSTLDSDAFLADALLGRRGKDDPVIRPGPHTWAGSYTEVAVSWKGDSFTLKTAHAGDDLVMLVEPGPSNASVPPTVVVSAGLLWNRPGSVARRGSHLEFEQGGRTIPVYCTGAEPPVATLPVAAPYFARPLTGPIGISTGTFRTVAEIQQLLLRARPAPGGPRAAIETVMGWDTIYEPSKHRVISPVSRLWSSNWGGYVLFDWDTFIAATLASSGDRDLAYANALEILDEATAEGFVPNYARPGGWKSFDRSEPPIGGVTLLDLYRRFGDRWVLRDAFPALLRWNEWWDAHRRQDGYLVLGTDKANPPGNPDDPSVGTRQGAIYESGLDNSPMYDGAPFQAATGRMPVADAGLMGLYVADCKALAAIADVLGKTAEGAALRRRAEGYGARLQSLWDEATGIYRNRNLETGALSPHLSPTNFYPLLAGVATPAQADRMVREHLMNPAEFWGEWVIPAIARNDPAFKDQEYWRGRIWGPMNYLVYLGLRKYDQPEARRQLAAKSLRLFELEWNAHGHVHENYNALTGQGDDVGSSDRFYHWGALLGYLDLLEQTNQPQAVSP